MGRAAACLVAPLKGLSDAVLVRRVLRPGQRTPLYRSASKVLAEYGPHHIYYFYLHVGTEIGRGRSARMGGGRPRVARLGPRLFVRSGPKRARAIRSPWPKRTSARVVRSADREAFYRFLRDTFVKNDLQTRLSTKSFKKRYTGI